jgi:hypothetical protein
MVVRSIAALTLILVGMSAAETDLCTRCGLIVRPSSLSFPPQQIRTRSAPMTITVSNGSVPAAVNIKKTGTAFQQSNNCLDNLQPRASCSIQVTFAPKAAKAFAGTITVDGIYSVSLSGTGVDNGRF